MGTKICKKCQIEKPLSEFYIAKSGHSWRMKICKKCEEPGRLKYREKNKEKILETARIWSLNNSEAVWAKGTIRNHRKKGIVVLIKDKELAEVAKKSRECSFCGIPLRWGQGKYGRGNIVRNSPTLDRLNNENYMTMDNIALICYSCNTTKGTRTLKEFKDYCILITKKI